MDDPFYKNPADGKPLVPRPRSARPKKPDLAFGKRQALKLHAKRYSAAQIRKGLAAVGCAVSLEQVELWIDGG